MMEHRGYLGAVAFDDQDNVFHGRVLGIRDTVTFEGTSVSDLRRAFRDSVDDYVDMCAERGEEPDRPFSGQFIVRMAPELHRAISLRAVQEGKSLNAWITSLLRSTIHPTGGSAPIETGARLLRAKKSKKR